MPSYKSVVDDLALAIRRGDLAVGSRLPTHRELARTRGVALATATRVYAELAAIGLVVGEPGRGTFVRDHSGADGPESERRLSVPRVADLSFTQPLTPGQSDDLRAALRRLAGSGDLDSLLRQQPPGGRRDERAVVATHLLDRGIDAAPDEVVLTNGAQQGLDAVLGVLTRPGDVVAVDELTYPGMKLLAAARHLELAPFRSHRDGPDLDALDRLCRDRPVQAIYTAPTLHNPLGWVLGEQEREYLAATARTHDCAIVEDGTHAFLDRSAPAPVRSLAADRTFYVSSFSKNVAPGLRFGFVVTPTRYAGAFRTTLRASTWGLPGLTAMLATGWVSDGTVARLERERRTEARARHVLARTALAGLDLAGHPNSYFIWVHLTPHHDRVANALARVGVLVSTADAFATGRHRPHGIRLSLGGTPINALEPALDLVRKTIGDIAP